MIAIGRWLGANLHPHLIFYTALALFILYRPPALLNKFAGAGDFITRHWGDSIGFYLLHLGVVLFIIGGVYPVLKEVQHVGESFILTAVGMLKLRYIPKDNGNGKPDALAATFVPHPSEAK